MCFGVVRLMCELMKWDPSLNFIGILLQLVVNLLFVFFSVKKKSYYSTKSLVFVLSTWCGDRKYVKKRFFSSLLKKNENTLET